MGPGTDCLNPSNRSAAMARKLAWMESQNLEGFVARALDKQEAHEAERDKAFAAHVCAKFPRKHSKD
jgi:hypothetical protein